MGSRRGLCEAQLQDALRLAAHYEKEVLESVVTWRRDRAAVLKFLKKLIKRSGTADEIVTDRLRSYRAAMRGLRVSGHRDEGRWIISALWASVLNH
ncbi:DDE-type integrase/transposase/recombinase [Histidinibacterium aquaticum]|uniref:DDE-type integrase/transposase/recombinase n=1 Tax=Histidinibacterium aquaticum TaxID=2613962 RepID=A0A5J5GC52_9RHOB|nr:DDE-type integrase/transposase/recombinase [Histidinibacterium aquaticum]KAA9005749.1 DDE-type integrase/transposase/recombinase [Histidinibacterium aquaticum]